MKPNPSSPVTPDAAFAVIADVLRKLSKDALPGLSMETRLDALPGMDSLKSLHVIALVEERFGVEIDIARLDHHLEQVSDIVSAITSAPPVQSATASTRDNG